MLKLSTLSHLSFHFSVFTPTTDDAQCTLSSLLMNDIYSTPINSSSFEERSQPASLFMKLAFI